jgi:hypothetical protein
LESFSSSIIPWASSYHHHVTLCVEREEDLGPISFGFNTLLFEEHEFYPLVYHSLSQWITGSLVKIWEQKLKETKSTMKSSENIYPSPEHMEVLKRKGKIEELQDQMERKEVNP